MLLIRCPAGRSCGHAITKGRSSLAQGRVLVFAIYQTCLGLKAAGGMSARLPSTRGLPSGLLHAFMLGFPVKLGAPATATPIGNKTARKPVPNNTML